MFRFHRLAFVSRTLVQLYKTEKHHEHIFKFSQILSNSGCLIAGCCFSRQSDEESLIDGIKNKHENFPKFEKGERIHSNSNFETHASTSKDMKRSFESINDVVVQDADNCENSVLVSDVCNKRKKINNIETAHDKSTQEALPDSECDTSTTVIAEPTKADFVKSKAEIAKPKYIRPNYFVAVKISDDQIRQSLTEVQSHILEKEPRLKGSMTKLDTLHITLMVMNIGDPETHARALKALENSHQEYDEDISRNPINLEFQGLGHFQNRVLYAKLSMDSSYERFQSLAESVKKNFAAASIFSADLKKDFTPHLTVAKIDGRKKKNKCVQKIDPSLYKEFSNNYFGSQKISSIQLLSMLDPKDEAGYYSGTEIFFSAFDLSVRRNSLNEKLETEEKKKKIKDMINAMMKEKMK